MSMATSTAEHEIQVLSIVKEIAIAAPIEIAFEAVLEEIGPGGQMPDGQPFPRVIERWPGGRWYRDLGNNTGHFWGHVQVIKPPTLLELCGPFFMSSAATNFVQYRLMPEGKGTRLKLTHQAFGQVPSQARERMPEGWDYMLKRVAEIADRLTKKR
jgi:uncharacterized protein YndB with AHSA1/START domain